VAHHVADDQPGPFTGQGHDVIPVAAGVVACCWQAPAGDLEPVWHHAADGRPGRSQRFCDRLVAHEGQGAGNGSAGAGGEVRGRVRVGAAEPRRTGTAGQDQQADCAAPGHHRRGEE